MSGGLFDLHGKTALVTGASGGLGPHCAMVLAKAGAQVVIGARRAAALQDVSNRIEALGGDCVAVDLDVTDPGSIAATIAAFPLLDILINNAGITREGALLDLSEGDSDAVMDTNAKGMFLMTQATARAMRAHNRGGAIINIASILGYRQAAMVASYASSKAAALQLTKVSALELTRFGIRVNALAPGYVRTNLNAAFFDSAAGHAMIQRIPQRRLGRPEDLDGALLLLASPASTHMTGAVIVVDGGHGVSTL